MTPTYVGVIPNLIWDPEPMNENNQGFTLIEILVVMAIFVLIAGFALVVSMDSYRSHNFKSEQDLLVAVLLKARSQAMNNINQLPHGVYIPITHDKYSLFQGSTCTSGIDFPVSKGFTPSASCIVFTQLSGATAATSITLTDNTTNKVFTININNEGQINY
jgi:prepilin-type N-terminal cleavage/methylation domain-containing protein